MKEQHEGFGAVDDNPIVRARSFGGIGTNGRCQRRYEAERLPPHLKWRRFIRKSSCSTFLCRQNVLVSIFLPELPRSASNIMLTSTQDSSTIRLALERGARGYLVHRQLGASKSLGYWRCGNGGLVLGQELPNVCDPRHENATHCY